MNTSVNAQNATLPKTSKTFFWVYSLALLPILFLRFVLYYVHIGDWIFEMSDDWDNFVLLSVPFYIIMFIAAFKQDKHNGSYLGSTSVAIAFVGDSSYFNVFPMFFIFCHFYVYAGACIAPKNFAKFVKNYDEPLENMTAQEKNKTLFKAYSKNNKKSLEAQLFVGLIFWAFFCTMILSEYF